MCTNVHHKQEDTQTDKYRDRDRDSKADQQTTKQASKQGSKQAYRRTPTCVPCEAHAFFSVHSFSKRPRAARTPNAQRLTHHKTMGKPAWTRTPRPDTANPQRSRLPQRAKLMSCTRGLPATGKPTPANRAQTKRAPTLNQRMPHERNNAPTTGCEDANIARCPREAHTNGVS